MERRILIVDDSAFARRKLRQILEPQGYSVEEAATGAECLEKYVIRKPDATLLDIVMEGMNGLEVLAQLRRLDPEARVIIATADLQSATHKEALGLGAVAVVNKPFIPDEVLAALQRPAVVKRASP